MPTGGFGFELYLSFSGQAIERDLAPGVGRLPIGSQQTAVFQPVQCRVERALGDLHDVARHLLEALRDGVPVDRAERGDLQNQQVQGALREIRFRRHCLYLELLQVKASRVEVQGMNGRERRRYIKIQDNSVPRSFSGIPFGYWRSGYLSASTLFTGCACVISGEL